MMEDRLSAHPIPVQIPIGSEADFRGIIELIRMDAACINSDDGADVREDPTRTAIRRPRSSPVRK